MPKIEDLKSLIHGRGGLAMQNRYRLYVTPPKGVLANPHDFNIMCDSCSLPSRQILSQDYQSVRQSQKIANGYINDDVSFTFILTNDYYAKDIFDAWAAKVIDFGKYRAGYLNDYTGTVQIMQTVKKTHKDAKTSLLDEKTIYSATLLGAYPILFSSIPLSNDSQNTVQKFGVTMTYMDFTTRNLISNATS